MLRRKVVSKKGTQDQFTRAHLDSARTKDVHAGFMSSTVPRLSLAVTATASVALLLLLLRRKAKKRHQSSTTSILGAINRRAGAQPQVLVDEPGSLVYLLPGLLSAMEQMALFERLSEWDGWKRESDDFGPQGRLTAYVGEPGAIFSFVGLVCHPHAAPPILTDVFRRVNEVIAESHGTKCTGCLLNNYTSDDGHIPWHSDEVRAHGPSKLVVAVSTGGSRPFDLRRRGTSDEEKMRVLLPPGSALVMCGETQAHWQHALPLEPPAPQRISLTFRSIEIGFEEGREPPHCV